MELTLQINLSGGDLSYARTTVPLLVAAHRPRVAEVIGVVDCCRPQRTQMNHPDKRFPETSFRERVKAICRLAEQLRCEGILDRLVFVREGDPRIAELLKKYAGGVIRETHDCYGCGLVSYLFGFEEARTRFMIHYDADMLLHQGEGYDWSDEALQYLEREPKAIAATPRVSPPFADDLNRPDAPSLHESDVFLEADNGFWRVGWFSARCFLIDLNRLQSWLPLLSVGNMPYLCEVVARKVLSRGYPPPTEILIHQQARRHGGYRVDLMTTKSFVLHPNNKGEQFLRLLPGLVESIRLGNVPPEQRGWENLKLDAWEEYLAAGQA